MRLLLALAAAVALLLCACGGGSDTPVTATLNATDIGSAYTPGPTPQTLESTTLTFHTAGGDVTMRAEMARNETQRAVGLMYRQSMDGDHGMIFVWPDDTNATFWMKNTYIPLSIAWVKAEGTIIGFDDMEPQTTVSHAPPGNYRYAIEANQGWFADERGGGGGHGGRWGRGAGLGEDPDPEAEVADCLLDLVGVRHVGEVDSATDTDELDSHDAAVCGVVDVAEVIEGVGASHFCVAEYDVDGVGLGVQLRVG